MSRASGIAAASSKHGRLPALEVWADEGIRNCAYASAARLKQVKALIIEAARDADENGLQDADSRRRQF